MKISGLDKSLGTPLCQLTTGQVFVYDIAGCRGVGMSTEDNRGYDLKLSVPAGKTAFVNLQSGGLGLFDSDMLVTIREAKIVLE